MGSGDNLKITSVRMTALIIYISALLLARLSFASDCKELGVELDSMRKAQNQIMQSLVKNHQSFADNMSELADNMSMNSGRASRSSLMSIKKTAKAYRVRGDKAEAIAQKLDFASEDLIVRVKKCLK